MTEKQWLKCANRYVMLRFLLGKGFVTRFRRWLGADVQQLASIRKVMLFNCACGRRMWGEMTEPARKYLIGKERYADGEIDEVSLRSLAQQAHGHGWYEWHGMYGLAPVPLGQGAPYGDMLLVYLEGNSFSSEMMAQVSLLRDIFGNPFRRVTIDPAWLTSTVVSLATAIYDDRAFDRLPILADALEDTGCDNADILNHCRQPGAHVRGCWPVDLLLGRQ